VNFTIEIESETAANALIESLGWSIGAVSKQIDRGLPSARKAAVEKWLALDGILADIQAARRDSIEQKLEAA
jgi:hypothetical protein